MTTGKEIRVLFGGKASADSSGSTRSAAFSPDGSRIITSTDDISRIWDAGTGAEIAVLRGHKRGLSVNSSTYSPDGSRIVTVSADRTARIWDATTTEPIAVLDGHDGEVNSGMFSPDGTHVVTASSDGTARIWDVQVTALPTRALIAEVCKRMTGMSVLSHSEMHLAGYDSQARQIDVCGGPG